MKPDPLISLLAAITLVELMVSIGLGVTVSEVVRVAMDWRMVCQAVVANYIVVPGAAVGLLALFHAQPLVAAGFLVVAVSPGAAYGPPFAALARGNVVAAVGLMVILAGSATVLAPLLLRILLPVVTGSASMQINTGRMVSTLMLSQFLPLCVGLYIRQRRASLAAWLKKPAARLSVILNLLLIATILAVQFRTLAEIRLRGYVGMLALLAASMAAGWLLGGPGRENRGAMTMATSVRNVGVALVIVTASFPGTAAVTAATAYGLFQTIIMALVALAWGRLVLRFSPVPARTKP